MSGDYDALLSQYHMLPDGPERIVALDEIIRLADSNNDVVLAYQLRRQLAQLASEKGFPEKSIVAFSWCLSRFDQNPEIDDWHDLLWQYKVILELIPIFVTVSRDQIIGMQEDMAARLAQHGQTQRTAHYYRSWNYMRMGDYVKALEYQEEYLQMKRTSTSDCLACERDRQVELLSRMQKDKEALKRASRIMSGTMRCGEVPEFTNGHIVKSQLRLGLVDEATERQKEGYEKVRRERKYLGTIGDLLLVLVHNRNFEDGLKQIRKHLPWAAETASAELKFRFLASVALFLEAFAEARPQKLKIKVPVEFSFANESSQYDPKELAANFSKETQTLADQFNARNGNDTYTRILEEYRQLCGM